MSSDSPSHLRPDSPGHLRPLVLIPIRSFDDAKSRLSPSLSAHQRRDLAVAMASVVVAAADDLPVWVITEDTEVAEWAGSVGAEPVAVNQMGLTNSIEAAVAAAAGRNFSRVIIAHSDLPFANNLAMVTGTGLAIAPDRRRDGSNVMSVPTDAGFRFAYGPGSFSSHVAEAERLGLNVDVIDAPDLAWDVDEPDDLPGNWRNLIDQIPVSGARTARPALPASRNGA